MRTVTRSCPVVLLVLLALVPGCTTTRTVTVIPKPEDAMIKINRVDRGRGQVTETLRFDSPSDVHVIEARRTGYKDASVQITRDDPRKIIELNLAPQTRDIHFAVEPVPAVIKINGKAVTDRPVAVWTEQDLPFTV